jgi:diguanylate cyclase
VTDTPVVEVSGLADAVLAAPSDALRAIVTALLEELGPQRGSEILLHAGQGLARPTQPSAAPAVPTVEGATRPLLETLHSLTGMASTYLTVVDEDEGVQEVRYVLNRGEPDFSLDEGIVVPWEDTLCKRSLDEGRACTTDVPGTWPDSAAAAALGIRSYISVPVRLTDGRLWGTLCAADGVRVPGAEQHLPTMTMFAQLIASEVERATALHAAQREAETDELTGCLTRRAVDRWLTLVRDAAPEAVACAFADLNAFKQVNDTFGHAAGDAVLAAVGAELRRRCRGDDVVGRLGGDEFVVIAPLATREVAGFVRRWSQPLELAVRLDEGVVPVTAAVGVAVVPTRRARDVLTEADHAMYEAKPPH